jgi:hypothetical protein
MKKRLFWPSLVLVIFGLLLISPLMEVFGTEYSSASNYERAYTFEVQYGYYRFSHKLYMSMPPSLYDYYYSKSHVIRGDSDYAKFVTPGVFKSIAENIQNVTGTLPYSEEQFANAVLMLTRQVSYVKSDVKYPVETILDNSGDCDLLSLLAASIMKAGGLDVVLLYYKGISPSHMNIGVYLPYEPVYRTWWLAPAGFKYNNKTYWMAECTSLGEWKVGDRPDLLAGAKPQIISLENCEEISPAHVASSLDGPLTPSAISITMSPENSSTEDNGRNLTISGSISPAYAGKSIVMYVSQDASSYDTFRTTSTDEFGNYSFTWNFTSTGAYYIRTSVSGFSNYSSSDSEKLAIFTGFYRPAVPSTWSNDALARANAAPLYGFSLIQRSKDFLQNNLTGTGVLLSGEFMVLRKEQEATTLENEQTITIPGYTQSIRLPRSRRYAAVYVPEQVITVPTEQPANSWFGFILENKDEGNYTANVRVLSDADAARLTTQLAENNSAFMNVSMSARENMWYKVTAKIFESEKTAELYDANGTLLQNITDAGSVLSSVSESGVLVAYDPNAVVVFKNLKAETLSQPAPPVDADQTPAGDELEQLAPCIGLTVLLAVAVAAVTYIKERKRVTFT